MRKPPESLVAAVLVLLALVIFLGGMVFRSVAPALGGGWITELTIYLVVWGLLIGAAGCVAEQEHIRADFFVRMLGPGARRWVDLLAAVAGCLFCVALTWFGWLVVDFALLLDERSPSIMQFPKVYFYTALPVSMAICSVRYFIEISRLARPGAGR
jgi:C4-dicarboxylate transporter, DctQ subunit